ncbi:MAG TPA: hypothetical protein VES59_01720 [Bacteroidota bacterium]|nr:hypothetical protein [Bacteroidota bacterium]
MTLPRLFPAAAALTMLLSYQSPGQIDTTLKDFFPLRTGNVWQYRNEDSVLSTGRVGVADTLMPNGQRYYGLGAPNASPGGYAYVRIDSLLRVQYFSPYLSGNCGGENSESNIYRLNEPAGAVWRICENIVATRCRPWFMRFDGISRAAIFGKPRQVMRFTPGAYCPQTGDTVWYPVNWLLVRGIGIYHEETLEKTHSQLTGAMINGVQYGRVVSLSINSPQK